MSIAPDNGNKTKGNKAVIAIGTASVTHQIAIHNVTAKTACPLGGKPSKLPKTITEVV
jgi:hypothetical protein